MKTRIFSLLIALLLLLAAGCSNGDTGGANVDIDPDQAAQSIAEAVGFGDLVPISDNLLGSYYSLDDAVTDYAIYIDGSGATAREIAVLKVAQTSDAAKAKEVLETRVSVLAKEFENYVPAEMAKINDPVIVEKGTVVYMVLSDTRADAENAIASLYN